MIDRVLVKTYANQSSLLLGSLGLVLFAFAWVRVWIGTFFNLSQYKNMLDQLTEFEKFAPIEFSALMSYAGQVAMVYDEPIVILCVVIWSISRGSDVVSGELGRGTLEMLLAQPISRTKLMLSQALVSVVGLAILCACLWVGLGLGIQTNHVEEEIPPPSITIPLLGYELPFSMGEPLVENVPLRERVDVMAYASSTFHLFSLGFFILALSTMISSMDRYRWRTIGLVVGIYIIQLVMFGLGKASTSLVWLLNLSFFSCYKPQRMAAMASDIELSAPWSLTSATEESMTLPPMFYPLILIGLGVLFYVIAIRQFESRDLPAPL